MYHGGWLTVVVMTTSTRRPRKPSSGKRPCSVCRRWYFPDPRTRHCQKTCGRPECRREQQRRTQAQWRDRHPDYDTARRVRKAIERAQQGELALRGPPRELEQLPVDLAQEALGQQGLIIIAILSRLVWRGAQKALRAQVAEIAGNFDRLGVEAPQKAIEAARRPP
jgi:hypothetical protein